MFGAVRVSSQNVPSVQDLVKDFLLKKKSFGELGFLPRKRNNKEKHESSHDTPRKINMEPENGGLEDDFPFPGVYSQIPC